MGQEVQVSFCAAWLHSDVKDMAYLFTYRVFNDLTQKAKSISGLLP